MNVRRVWGAFEGGMAIAALGIILRFAGKWLIGNVSDNWAAGDWLSTNRAWLQGAFADIGMGFFYFGAALVAIAVYKFLEQNPQTKDGERM